MPLLLALIFVLALTSPMRTEAASSANAATTPSLQLQVERFKLPNGLNVLFHVDHSAPLVAYYTIYKVGSVNEQPGYTGIAHLFEHLMFKGAKKYDGKAFDRLLGRAGAVHNAFTTRDLTTYYAVVPSDKLNLIMDLESDRMANLQVTEENLKSEREVVKEERRFRVENQPQGALFEAIYATVFKSYPYRWPVIGWMQDLDHIDINKCREFFKTYYSPNNATIVIAGDFDISDAKSLLQKYYGGIPSQNIPILKTPIEPEQKAQREMRVSKNVQNEHLALSFRTPDGKHEDNYPLEILTEILGGGEFSRLYKKLVYNQQSASIVGADNAVSAGPGVLTIYLSLKPGVNHDEALQATYAILWDARNKLFTEKELQIAEDEVLKEHVGQS